ERVSDAARRERNAQRAVTRALRADGQRALDELLVAPAGETVAAMTLPAGLDDGHVAVGAGEIAFGRTGGLAQRRLHELCPRACAAIGEGEFVATRAGCGGVEPAVAHDRVRSIRVVERRRARGAGDFAVENVTGDARDTERCRGFGNGLVRVR